MIGAHEPLDRLKSFLLVNRGWSQIVVKNTFWVALAEGVARILKFALILLIVRQFGPTEFGKFAFAFSFVTMFGIIFDSGLTITATREFSRRRENEQLLPDILLLRLVFGMLGMLIISLGMLLVTRDPAVRVMMLALGAYLFVGELVSISYAVFRARQKMEYETFLRITQAAILLAAVALVMWKAPSVVNATYAYLGAGLVTLGIVGTVAWERRWQLRFRLRLDVWKRLLRIALPLALVGGVGAVYMNMDSVMLGYSGRITEAGWYNAATRINGILVVPMSILALVLFPAFVSTARSIDEAFRKRWNAWVTVSIATGVFFWFLVLATSDRVVDVAFGEAFHPSSAALKIIVINALLMYAYMPWYQAMIIFDQQKKLLLVLLSAALINIVLNAALIPSYGLYGAAWATVITHLVILIGLLFLAGRFTPLRPSASVLAVALISSVLAGALASVVMKGTAESPWFAIPLGTLVFVAGFIGIRKAIKMIMPRERLSYT